MIWNTENHIYGQRQCIEGVTQNIWTCLKSLNIFCLFFFTEDYDKEIEDEKKKITELDAKIRDGERKIKSQHRNMGGVHMSSQHTVQTQKTMRTLENRLDQVKLQIHHSLFDDACF